MSNPVLHIAGEPQEGDQRCTRCGFLLAHFGVDTQVLGGGFTGQLFWSVGPVTVWEGFPVQFAVGEHDGAVLCKAEPKP